MVTQGPDVVLASSMMDAAEFRHAAGLTDVPLALYMHENQLTYDRSEPELKLGSINWRSVQEADRVLFNSRFHLNDFFAALPLLNVEPGAITAARDKSQVVSVGIDLQRLAGPSLRRAEQFTVMWNHRWEADKDPAAFVEALEEVSDPKFHLVLGGEQRDDDPLVARLAERFGSRVLAAGFAPEGRYGELMRTADVVVSTARQEFFGVSIAEAMFCGAIPVVPDRLAYPELIPEEFHDTLLYADGELARRLLDLAGKPELLEEIRPVLQTAAAEFDWLVQAPVYDDVMESLSA